MRLALILRVAWELYLRDGKDVFWDTSSVVFQRIMGCFGLSSLDTLIDGGQRQVDHARACVPCPIRCCVGAADAAQGTMQGRGVLFPESGLKLTAYLVLPPPGGLCLGSQVGEISKQNGGGHVADL